MPGCPIPTPIKPPHYRGDVGYDLGAAIHEDLISLSPHGFIDVPTYIKIELPDGYWGDIRSRSSTFAKRRLIVMPGTIDNTYRGMLSVFIYNPNSTHVAIHRGDFLAQLVLVPIMTPLLCKVDSISPTERGEKGFGSSGGFKQEFP